MLKITFKLSEIPKIILILLTLSRDAMKNKARLALSGGRDLDSIREGDCNEFHNDL